MSHYASPEGREKDQRSMMVDYHPSPHKTVLVVDDTAAVRRQVRHFLLHDDFIVREAATGMEGLESAQQDPPDVILLDIKLPDVDGFDICRLFKSDSRTMLIPIIFITSQTATDEKVKGLDLGAHDYMTKPFHPVELRARVRSAYRFKHLLDLLERKARIDPLTGLYNRLFFKEQLKEEVGRAKRLGHEVALVMVDIDHFKQINDNHGHPFGDTVLVALADCLSAQSAAVVARLGGEEFAVLLRETSGPDAVAWAEASRCTIDNLHLLHKNQEVLVTASFGIATLGQLTTPSPDLLVEAADQALYQAKHAGRNRVCIWDPTKVSP